MNENDRLLRRLLTRIQQHGYYHQVDVALVDWFLTNASVKEISAKHFVQPNAMYQQKSRLARARKDVDSTGQTDVELRSQQ